jgi:hypothetical protein
MPRVTIKTGFTAADGKEEVLHEYLCDIPGCGNIAVLSLGPIVELRQMAMVCDEHRPGRPQQAAP